MGGDGMGAMAAAIFAVMVALVAGGALLFFVAARLLGRRLSPARARLALLLAVPLGLAAGALAVTVIFYPDRWRPPPTLRLVLPPGADPAWIVLLEDRAAGRALAWTGVEAPFSGVTATLAVPPGGVVRVDSLARLGGGNTAVRWPDGTLASGHASGPAPAGTRATAFAAWTRRPWSGTADDLPDGALLAAWIHARE